MFGSIGGLSSLLWMFASFFVGVFSSKIFMTSLISSFYSIISSEDSNQSINLNRIPHEEIKQPDLRNNNMNKSINENFSNISKDEKLWNELEERSVPSLSNSFKQNNDTNELI